MKRTTMTTLAVVFVMGMAAMPSLALSAETGMDKAGSMMMKDESTMSGSMAEEKAGEMKEEMASGEMQEPMTGEMKGEMEVGEMHQPMTGEMKGEMEAGEESGGKMMQ